MGWFFLATAIVGVICVIFNPLDFIKRLGRTDEEQSKALDDIWDWDNEGKATRRESVFYVLMSLIHLIFLMIIFPIAMIISLAKNVGPAIVSWSLLVVDFLVIIMSLRGYLKKKKTKLTNSALVFNYLLTISLTAYTGYLFYSVH